MFPAKCNRKEPCNFRTLGGNCFLTECALPKPQKTKAKPKRSNNKAQEA